ncbi:MAG: septation protein SpoVG family protein [Candidatus Omnitrophota bacterium]
MTEKLITNVEIIPIKPKQGHLGFVNIIFDNALALNGIALHSNLSNGNYRLVYPDKILANGKVVQVFHPINRVVANRLNDVIFEKYEQLITKIIRN